MEETEQSDQERGKTRRFLRITGDVVKEGSTFLLAGAALSQDYKAIAFIVAAGGFWVSGRRWRQDVSTRLEDVVIEARPPSPPQSQFTANQASVRVGVIGDHIPKEYSQLLQAILETRLGIAVTVISEKAETNSAADRAEPQFSKLTTHAKDYFDGTIDALVFAPGTKKDITGEKTDFTPIRSALNDASDSREHALMPSAHSPIAFVLLPTYENVITKNLPRLLRAGFTWVQPQYSRRGIARHEKMLAIANQHNESADKINQVRGEIVRKKANIVDLSRLSFYFDSKRGFYLNDGSKAGEATLLNAAIQTADALEDGIRALLAEEGVQTLPKNRTPRKLALSEIQGYDRKPPSSTSLWR